MSNTLYYCYSINLLNFLLNKGFKNISKGKHHKTKKLFWVFDKTPEFCKALGEFNK